jgi:sulfite reductase alpha subunit-like flavoprotein
LTSYDENAAATRTSEKKDTIVTMIRLDTSQELRFCGGQVKFMAGDHIALYPHNSQSHIRKIAEWLHIVDLGQTITVETTPAAEDPKGCYLKSFLLF